MRLTTLLCGVGSALCFGALGWNLTACAEAAGASPELKAEIIALEKQAIELGRKGDKEGLGRLMTDDFVQVDGEGVIGKQAALELLELAEADDPGEATEFQVVSISPEVALVTYKMTYKAGDSLWFSSLWTRRDGRRLSAFLQISQPPPPEPPQTN